MPPAVMISFLWNNRSVSLIYTLLLINYYNHLLLISEESQGNVKGVR